MQHACIRPQRDEDVQRQGSASAGREAMQGLQKPLRGNQGIRPYTDMVGSSEEYAVLERLPRIQTALHTVIRFNVWYCIINNSIEEVCLPPPLNQHDSYLTRASTQSSITGLLLIRVLIRVAWNIIPFHLALNTMKAILTSFKGDLLCFYFFFLPSSVTKVLVHVTELES